MLLSVVLACRVFAFSCQYICAIVVILFALSWVISVQQFTKFLRFRYSSFIMSTKALRSVWFVCLCRGLCRSVCQQDYCKSNQQISLKLGV